MDVSDPTEISTVPKQVVDYLEEDYQLSVTKIKTLVSYADENFYVESTNPDGNEEEFVFKVFNPASSRQYLSLHVIPRLLVVLKSNGFPCPTVVPNKNGSHLCHVQSFSNTTLFNQEMVQEQKKREISYVVCLLKYLPGVTICDLEMVPDNIFEEMGEHLGRMHKIFQEVSLDTSSLNAIDASQQWSLTNVSDVINYLNVVSDPQRAEIVRDVIDEFESHVLAHKDILPKGVIHGDYNHTNILASQTAEEVHLTGVIDFDEVCYSHVVFDVGIAVMYVLSCNTQTPNNAVALFLKGYSTHRQLTHAEIDCLYYCVAARFTQSLVYGLHTYNKTHNDYVIITQARGWDMLEQLWRRGKTATYKQWQI